MHHDSLPNEKVGPASQRIADVREAYTEITRQGLEVMATKTQTDAAYVSNDNGHLAWDVSLLIRAACLMWRTTGEPVHLRQAVDWAQHLCERTDEARGAPDWRGRKGPVWSAGSRYTAGVAQVVEIGHVSVQIQAAAETIVIERPSETTAVIRAMGKDGKVWSAPEASLLPEADTYLPDVLARRSTTFCVQVRGLPTAVDLTALPAGSFRLKPQFAPHFVHTGMIARSLISAAEALEASTDTMGGDITPGDLFAAAERALLFHDDEIRIQRGQAWYITPEDFPGRRLKLELPHNQVVDAATAFMLLGRREGNANLRDLGASLARRFTQEIDAYTSGTLAHPWNYYPVNSTMFSGVMRDSPLAERLVRGVARGEDSSHATMRTRALLEWKAIDHGIVSDNALQAIALAFRRFYMTSSKGIPTLRWLPGDDANAPRRGYADTFSGAWGRLAPWDSSIKRRVNSMAYRHPPTELFGATILSSAEIVAMNAGVPTYAFGDRSAPA